MECTVCGHCTAAPSLHRQRHRASELGELLPAGSRDGPPLLQVRANDPLPLQTVAMAMHRHWARETGNSPNGIHVPATRLNSFDDGGLRSYLLTEGHRAVASITVGRVGTSVRRASDGTTGAPAEGGRLALSSLFVARAHRRTGLAQRLVTEFAACAKVALGDLCWILPLTDGGAAFAYRLTGGGPIWVARQ